MAITTGLAACGTAAVRTDFPTDGPIERGAYHLAASAWSVAGLTLTMPEGWEAQYGSPGAIKQSRSDGEVAFYFVVVDAIFSDPCPGGDRTWGLMEFGAGVDDLAQALLDQPFTDASGPVDTTIGGFPAQRIDLAISADFDAGGCNIPGWLQIWYSPPADKYFVLLDGGTSSVYIIDIVGQRQVLLTSHHRATAEDIAEMQAIIESITIDS